VTQVYLVNVTVGIQKRHHLDTFQLLGVLRTILKNCLFLSLGRGLVLWHRVVLWRSCLNINPEDEGSTVHRKVGILPQHYTASQPKRLRLETSPQRKPQISHQELLRWGYISHKIFSLKVNVPETLVCYHNIARRQNPEDHDQNLHRSKNLKFQMFLSFLTHNGFSNVFSV
jgi:hypothetical protein